MRIDCRFCKGPRSVDHTRCTGCAMPHDEAKHKPEPPGKRPCPMCTSRVVHWCEGNTRLKCIGCATVFEPLTGEVY